MKWAHEDGTILYAAIYVDDIILISNSMDVLLEAKEALKHLFNMSDLGEVHWVLGLEVIHDRNARTITLSQCRYVEEILKCAGYSDACPIATPVLANEHMAKVDAPEVDVLTYQSGIGSLMYAMLGTRPDLAYTVGVLSQHTAKPGEAHQHALVHAFKYLRGTADYQLVFDGKKPWELTGYVDADWAGDVNDRRSISGYTFLLAGGAISWSSKKQNTTALSSTEAEYIVATHAAKEATWLRTFLSKIGRPCKAATLLLMDNQSAMAIAWNPAFHARTKHIDMRYHFLREKVEAGAINLQYVPTGDQVADVLMKGLVKAKHNKFSEAMGMRHTS
ncbi:hypothetical protein EWM64_g6458 [Hericium alpestre]|uniref:Reverse transcriptase Ty1/copia-type domain-containing protein n=1 Tax=Hericium alpestre TaxID=135208 RepID=A0A4Y9ZSL8_9AGAM|nr:hypothetical protein EWM64_g6458 [Hericium alpestre]